MAWAIACLADGIWLELPFSKAVYRLAFTLQVHIQKVTTTPMGITTIFLIRRRSVIAYLPHVATSLAECSRHRRFRRLRQDRRAILAATRLSGQVWPT